LLCSKGRKGDEKKEENFGQKKGTFWRMDWEHDNYEPGDVGSNDNDAADDESDESESRMSMSPEGTKKATLTRNQQKKKATAVTLPTYNQKRGTPTWTTKRIPLLAILERERMRKTLKRRESGVKRS